NSAITVIYALSLHDALPIWRKVPLGVEIVNGALTLAAGNKRVTYSEAWRERCPFDTRNGAIVGRRPAFLGHIEPCINGQAQIIEDRKSTRLNSSHRTISYAV